jgi:hypothetical protein
MATTKQDKIMIGLDNTVIEFKGADKESLIYKIKRRYN